MKVFVKRMLEHREGRLPHPLARIDRQPSVRPLYAIYGDELDDMANAVFDAHEEIERQKRMLAEAIRILAAQPGLVEMLTSEFLKNMDRVQAGVFNAYAGTTADRAGVRDLAEPLTTRQPPDPTEKEPALSLYAKLPPNREL